MHRASYRFMPPCGITETLSDVESVRVVHEINSTKEDSIRFWKSIGFTPNGKDEYDIPLFIKKAGLY